MLRGGSLKASRKSVSIKKLGERACFIKTACVAPCSAVRVRVCMCVCVCVFFMTYWSVVNLCFVEGDKKLQTYLQSRKSVSPREWGKGRCERHNVCSLRFS